MKIITYVRDGAVSHCDNVGSAGRIIAGDVQVMSAGAGIRQAQFNLDPRTTRIFEIWIKPNADGLLVHGTPGPFRNETELAASLRSLADSRPIVRHCRLAQKRGYSAPL